MRVHEPIIDAPLAHQLPVLHEWLRMARQVINENEWSRVESITNVTASRTLRMEESGASFTNAGASAEVNVTLPSAATGLTYTFVVMAAQNLRVTAASGDRINNSALAGNMVSATARDALVIVAVDATDWIVISLRGTWTTT